MKFRDWALYLLLAGLMFGFAFPLLWMLSYSLRPVGLPPPTRLEMFAPPYAFENYLAVVREFPIAMYASNSFKVVLLAVPLTLLTASWAGFAIAQVSPRERRWLLAISVALMLVPAPAVWVPRFIIFTGLDWIDTLAPLIAPAVMGTSPFYVIMFYLAFARVPLEVYESARLDGANAWQVWYRLALPLARPTTIAVLVLSFVLYWSNYVDPLLFLRAEPNFTFPVGLQYMEQLLPNAMPRLMAAAVIFVAPVVALFVIAQRFFLQGQIALARWLQ